MSFRDSFRMAGVLRFCCALLLFVATGAIILYICAFKLIDNDFFWHVKAGELMWNSGSLIRIEPFSYVLAGRPYTVLHEWLAQIVFFLVFRSGGATAAILLRGVLSTLAAFSIMMIDRWSLALTAPLAVTALYIHRASLMVRPQLFTIALLALSLLIAFRYLRLCEDRAGRASLLQRSLGHVLFFCGVLLIQLLWVNLHGASAVFGVLGVAALFLQSALDWYGADSSDRSSRMTELRFRGALLAAVLLAMLASPNVFKTFSDMYLHRFDRTIPLVREWMPLSARDYAIRVLPFAVLAAAMTATARRSWLFCAVILAVTGVLSLQAYRHCIIFVLTCLGVTVFQLSAFGPWIQIRDRLRRFPLIFPGASLLLLLGLWILMYRQDLKTVFRNNDFGFGIHIPVEGAVDFVEREGIEGTLFNTYNEGGYILYRFAPARKVFADGRNIDYGYPFVQKILDAGQNPARWKELEVQYGFMVAIVEYKPMPEYGTMRPYITQLDADPAWKLVYLDDESTVYVRDLPAYAAVIDKYAYRLLSPGALEFTDTLTSLPEKEWPAAEAELRRVIAGSPRNLKASLLLADRLFATRRLDEAQILMRSALRAYPHRAEIYELLGRISADRQDWAEAGDYLERAVALSTGNGPQIDYGYLAMIFSKSGQTDKAEAYHRKAVRAGQFSPVAEDPSDDAQ